MYAHPRAQAPTLFALALSVGFADPACLNVAWKGRAHPTPILLPNLPVPSERAQKTCTGSIFLGQCSSDQVIPFSFNSPIYVPPSSMGLPCSITKWRSCNRRLSSQPGSLQSCSPQPRVSPAGCSTGNVSVAHDNLQNGNTSQRQPGGHEPCWNPGELLAVPPQLPHSLPLCCSQ